MVHEYLAILPQPCSGLDSTVLIELISIRTGEPSLVSIKNLIQSLRHILDERVAF
jgi:hypothetical protein